MITHEETCVAGEGNVDDSNVHNNATRRTRARTLIRGLIWWTRSRRLSLGSLGLWNIHNRVNYSIRKIEIEIGDVQVYKSVLLIALRH